MTNYHKANMRIWVLVTLPAYLTYRYSIYLVITLITTYFKFDQCPRIAIKKIHNYNDNMRLFGWGSNLNNYNYFRIMIFTLQHHILPCDLLDTLQHHNSFMMIFTHFRESKILFYYFHFSIFSFLCLDLFYLLIYCCLFAYAYS
jgi:hypothetical protein